MADEAAFEVNLRDPDWRIRNLYWTPEDGREASRPGPKQEKLLKNQRTGRRLRR